MKKSTLPKLHDSQIRERLLIWWGQNKRHFPWRKTRNPYKILIAETLLHRTQAKQVISLYQKFLKTYPDIQSITESTPEQIKSIVYSGGLSWRWKLLYETANKIKNELGGRIPEDFNTLVDLPGVNHYIASAIRCFAFGHPDILLDTNTVRITGRLTGMPISDSSRRDSTYRGVLEKLIDTKHPREFNFALIDFSALICKSKTPSHNECCLAEYCAEYKKSQAIVK